MTGLDLYGDGRVSRTVVTVVSLFYLAMGLFLGFSIGYIVGKG